MRILECLLAGVRRDVFRGSLFFGRELNRELGVPIGLIHATKGGTPIEPWTSRDALLSEPAGRRKVEDYEKGPSNPAERAEWQTYARDNTAWLRGKVAADPGNEGFPQGWAHPDYDDTGWDEMKVPARWQACGHAYNGVFWFRRVVEIPEALAGRDLVLKLGACDKHDTTYFNNVKVGATGWEVPDAWCTPRTYRIPAELVRAGRNVVATRIYSYMTDGGLIGPPHSMRIISENDQSHEPIPLTGIWRYKVEHNFGPGRRYRNLLVPAIRIPRIFFTTI